MKLKGPAENKNAPKYCEDLVNMKDPGVEVCNIFFHNLVMPEHFFHYLFIHAPVRDVFYHCDGRGRIFFNLFIILS